MGSKSNLIFHHGKIYTADAGRTIAEAVAVKDDTIVAVGGNDTVMAMADDQTETFRVLLFHFV